MAVSFEPTAQYVPTIYIGPYLKILLSPSVLNLQHQINTRNFKFKSGKFLFFLLSVFLKEYICNKSNMELDDYVAACTLL